MNLGGQHGIKRSAEDAANGGQPAASQPKLQPDFKTLFKVLKTQKRFLRGDNDYQNYCYQYSYTSHMEYGYMDPGAIIYPQQGTADDDVKVVIAFAAKYRLRIAVRTGGHQYSGASSTDGDNILLDMSEAYKDDFYYNKEAGLVRVGVSFELAMLNSSLGQHRLFVPHGQCSHVHVGGHAQTGGYGQLGRAFGLLGDHIEKLEIIIADGRKVEASRDASDPDLKDIFYAVLGGSPGNFGVLTHITLKPHKDDDYPESIGLKAFAFYNKGMLLRLMKLKAEMADDVDFPGDIDFCVTVMSGTWDIIHPYAPNLDEQEFIGSFFFPGGPYGHKPQQWFWPPMILVYLQWAGIGPEKGGATKQQATDFFDKVKTAMRPFFWPMRSDATHTEMSELTRDWVFTNVREYNLPYEKRTYVTRSTTLTADKWPEVVTNRIHALESDWFNGCKIVVQIQHFGGHKSAFCNKADSRTSYSWRVDSTVWCTLDCFYDENDWKAFVTNHKPKEIALQWQEENDRVLKGPDGCFSRNEDRRVLWATYGDYYKGEFNMGNVYRCYYEDQTKYDELCRIREKVDVMGVFMSNTFCVGVPPGPPPKPVVPALSVEPNIDDKYAAPLRERLKQRNEEVKTKLSLQDGVMMAY